jgi:D-glucosaminate-6-phosphate ammonia-lyase
MVDTARKPGTASGGIYERMGIRTLINGSGAATLVGGTLMPPEVAAAMAEAATEFVLMDELNQTVGERIAEATGAEAGYVTCGSAAAMALAAAACIAGNDPAKIRRLPDSTGMKHEIVICHGHRIPYDQMYRVGGGKLVEIGYPYSTERWELDRAITDATAAVAYHDSRSGGIGALDFATTVEVAHAHGLPVIVDAASTLPPANHLRTWIARGADLVIYSGGKGIRGPQDSGMLAGRKDLIDAARLNGSPHAGVGRGMKVSKEAMVGLWIALDLFLKTDHEADFRVHKAQVDAIAAGVANRIDTRCTVEDDWEQWPAPVIRIYPRSERWRPQAIRQALFNGDPAIHINVEWGGLMINTHCLRPGEERIVVDRLNAELDRATA